MTTIVLAESSGGEAVGGTERGRVGQRRVARETARTARRGRGGASSSQARPSSSVMPETIRERRTGRSAEPLPSGPMADEREVPAQSRGSPSGSTPIRRAGRSRRLPRPVRLAPRARADRLPRRRRVAGGARAARRRDTWAAALDFLYDHALDRAMGDAVRRTTPRGALVLRRARRTDTGPRRDPRPRRPILDEFRDRLAGGQMNAQHPRQFGYFTPPPLPISIMGELLAQMTNQGVDVWHAGPVRRVRRGGGRPLAVRPRRLRARRRSGCSPPAA